MALEKIKPRVVDETGNYTFNNVTLTGSILSSNANISNIVGITNLVANTTTITVTGNLTTTANVSAGNIKTDNLLYANGNPWSIGASSTPPGGSTTQVQFNNSGNFAGSANFTFNTSTNTLVVTNISGNGAQLSSLTGSNITGQVANALVSGTIYTNAQPNITSVGILTSLDITGTVTSGNANLGNATTSNYFIGNGSLLSSITGSNITGQVGYAAVANSVSGSNVSGPVTYAATANAVAGANVMGTVANALIAGTVYTNAQPNITSVGTLTSLSVTGDISGANLTLSGNLIVSGTTTSVNSTVTRVVDPIFELGGGANGAALATDDNKDRGLLLHYYSGSSTVDAFIGWDDSNGEFGVGSNVSVSSEVVTWNNYGNLRAEYFLGNGYYLTGVDAISATSADIANSIANGTSNINTPITDGNITVAIGGVSNTVVFTGTGINVAGYANISSGITTAGTITLGSGTGGNLTGANVLSANTMIASGNITAGNIDGGNLISANYISGNGYLLTGISAGSATSVVNGNSNISIVANSNASISIAGTSNVVVITSTGINLSGYINATRFVGEAGNVSNIQGANVSGNVTSAVQAHYANIANSVAVSNVSGIGNIATINIDGNASNILYGNGAFAAAPAGSGSYGNSNVATFLASYGSNTITTTGNVSVGNIIGNGQSLTSITGSNVSGNVTSAVQAHYANIANSVAGSNVSGTVATATNAGTVTTAAQPNITSVGSLSGLTVSNVTGIVDFTTTANVTLGNVSNLHITGGTANYVLKTDGAGNLSWTEQTGGAGTTTATIDNFTGNGVQTVFTLSTTPTSENDTIINYNGAILQKNVYSLSGSNITFVAPPANGSNLEITTLGVVSTNDLTTTGKAIAMAIVFGF